MKKFFIISLTVALLPSLTYGQSAGDTELTAKQINLLSKKATLLQKHGELDDAIEIAERALVAGEKLYDPYHVNVGFLQNNLARLYQQRGPHKDTEILYAKALEIFEANESTQDLVILTQVRLGRAYHAQRKYDEAFILFEEILPALREKPQAGHMVYQVIDRLGDIHLVRQEYNEARPLLEESVAYYQENHYAKPLEAVQSFSRMARFHDAKREYNQSKVLWNQILELAESNFGKIHRETAVAMKYIGDYHFRRGEYDEAEEHYSTSVDILRVTADSSDIVIAEALGGLVRVRLERKRYAGLEDMLLEALSIVGVIEGRRNEQYLSLLSYLEKLYNTEGSDDKAAQVTQLMEKVRVEIQTDAL